MYTAIDPHNGKKIREVPALEKAEVDTALEKAEAAYQVWKNKSFAERAQVMNKVAQKMKDNLDSLGYFMTEEMGKPVKEARGEVNKSIWCAEHYATHAEEYLKTEVLESDATESYVQYDPLGVILGVLPWNAPFWLAFRFLAPTIMAGNSAVIKHDAHVPGCGQAIADLFKDVGAPENLVQNLPMHHEVTEHAIRNPRVQAISFTGSENGGGKVASIAASEIKHSVLELGGSDPVVVLADANLEEAADIITLSRIINAGQSCIAAKRIIVEEPVYEKFTGLMKERLAKLKMGDPREESTDIGPIARADLRENLHRQVQDTVKAGGRCLLGGEIPEGEGFYYPVTLLADVKNNMCAGHEETFGPIAVMMSVKDADEAFAVANETVYGLAASLWTSTERGRELVHRLEAGQVVLNGIVKTDPRLPSGGIKRSGIGRELGPHGIHEFVNAKQVWIGPKKG